MSPWKNKTGASPAHAHTGPAAPTRTPWKPIRTEKVERSGTHQSFKKLLPVVQTPLTRILKPVGKQGPGQNPLIPNENPKAEHPSPWGQALQREARHQRPGLYQGQFKTRRDSSKLFYCYSHLKFKDPRQPSTLPKARPCGSPTCPGGRQGGWGKRRGEERARSDSFAPPPWPPSAIWDHPQDSSRTVTATGAL